MLISAVLGEAVGRSIDFFIRKCSKPQAVQDVEGRLGSVLLRAQVIIDEAMARQVTNQAMLQQLAMLRGAMHRGYYMLDSFRYQQYHSEEDAKEHLVSQSLSLCKLNSFCSSGKTHVLEQLQEVLDSLYSMILDASELVVFLKSCPHMYRQPYSMHLLLANSMFDRKMETERVVSFLLSKKPHHDEKPEVLPIVGPCRVGKSTLVAHVCKDERVYGHFSEILLLHDHDFTDDELAFRGGCAMKHQNHVSSSNNDKRLLVVVELAGDLNDDAWNRLYSAYKACLPRGSKIIVTSRSDKVVRF